MGETNSGAKTRAGSKHNSISNNIMSTLRDTPK